MVILYTATVDSIRYLSRYKNNSYASQDLTKILCDGLMALEEYYRCVGEWEETSWPIGGGEFSYLLEENGEEINVSEGSWPQHWSRFLREHKYWEERENKEEREYTKAKMRQVI
jgi:hypothetical protein